MLHCRRAAGQQAASDVYTKQSCRKAVTNLHIVIAVHDTGKDARAKLLYHVFQGFPLSAPGSHDTVLCCWYAHGHWLSIIQVELHNAAYFAQMKHMPPCQRGITITYQGSH